MISASNFIELIKENKKASEIVIPELIRRLVRESINNNTYTHFPIGDDIYNSGWDGLVSQNKTVHRFVPLGNSCFEIGTNKRKSNAISKLQSDFQKRCDDINISNKQEYTLILITTSLLDNNKKQNLTNNFNEKNVFKNVLILDAVDITDWMTDHINICIWLLKKFQKKLDDFSITLLEDEWERIANCTEPHLSTSLFKMGNERNAKKLVEDLKNGSGNKVISIVSKYYGRDFAFSFCVSSIISSNDFDLKDRTIVVNDQASMNYVNSFCSDKIVLVNFNCIDDRFVSHLNNTYVFFDSTIGEDISLEMFRQKDFIEQVTKLGFTSSEADRVGFNTGFNVLSLRRLLSKAPTIKTPRWFNNPKKNDLIPLLLLGEINMDNKECIEFLKVLVGENLDDYTEKLNLWSEMSDSPILKFGNIYRTCSRKEGFDFIQVDIFSIKLFKLEDKLREVLLEVDNKYAESEGSLFLDNRYLCNRSLIENIINGFIILSEKSRRNQLHYDSLVFSILTKTIGNLELSCALAQYMPILAELSPESFILYIKQYLSEDNKTFVSFVNVSFEKYIFESKLIQYVFSSLSYTLRNSKTVVRGLELMLDIYYLTKDNYALDEIIKYLCPISTICGIIVMPLSEKTKFFFNYAFDKPAETTKNIVNNLYGSVYKCIVIPTGNTYRSYENNEIKVNDYEFFDMQSKCFQWILNNQSSNSELLNSFKKELGNMHYVSKSEFLSHMKEYENKILSCDDEIKAFACVEILRVRENILKFSNWYAEYSELIPFFDSMILNLQPLDEYVRLRYLLVDDKYPLRSPIKTDEKNWYSKETKLRESEKDNCLFALINTYGKNILERIIKDCGNNFGIIWKLIYKHSENHLKDLKQMIELNYPNAIKSYFQYFAAKELKQAVTLYGDEELVINNLPFNKDVYFLVDGNLKEKGYWENQTFVNNVNDDFDYLFNKFLKFAPFKLLDAYSYFFDVDYNHCIQILNAIIKLLDDDYKTTKEIVQFYSLKEFINKMDSKYYTDELSFCEFKLLPILKGGLDDYPMGIKKYFWNKPREFAKLLIHLQNQCKDLPEDSLGKKILNEVFLPFGNVCFIPKDYLTQQRDKIQWWVKNVLGGINSCNNELKQILILAVINTLSLCPKNISDEVWPNKEVSDALELISSAAPNKIDVSRSFAISFLNRRGIRQVTDGTPEKKRSEEFEKYSQYYMYSNPVISKALSYISKFYEDEANEDLKNAVLGYN